MHASTMRGVCAAAAAGTLTVLGLTGSSAAATAATTLTGSPAAASTHSRPAANNAQLAPVTPAGRQWNSWAYDPAQNDFVMFGGFNLAGHIYGDTWTWNGSWTQQHPVSSPPPCNGAAIAWDPATSQLLLFGGIGNNNKHFNGTWTWTGTTWIRLHPATSPSPRTHADMIYDAAMGEIIMFGGDQSVVDGYTNQTWAWTGTTWTLLHPATSPSPRDTDSLVYDPATSTAIMYGGFNTTGRLSDTWSWNGTTWTQLFPATSPGVVSPNWQAAYDSASGQLVEYGGEEVEHYVFSDETWTWTGTTWMQLQPPANPGPLGYGMMSYDPELGEVVLFGGTNGTINPTGVWEWNGTTWQLVPPSPPPACPSSELDVWMNTHLRHVAGSGFTTVNFTNLSGNTCTLRGFPQVDAVNLTGQQLGSPARPNGFKYRTVTLTPGATATAELTITNATEFPPATCQPVTGAGLSVVPPAQTAAKQIPYPFAACSRPGPRYLTIGPVTTPTAK
jgi:hypothetical protein